MMSVVKKVTINYMDGTSTSSSHFTLPLSSLSRPPTRVGDVDGIGN